MIAKPSAATESSVADSAGTRVFIVDDHELYRYGLRMLIDNEQDLTICGEAANEADATRQLGHVAPDVVVVDLSLGSGTGLDIIKWVKKNLPSARTVVSTMHDEKVYGERVFRAGASGYVNKQDPAHTILEVIRRVREGQVVFSEQMTQRMLRQAVGKTRPKTSLVETLSDRELEIFRLLGQGMKSSAIGKKLDLSPSTIDTYRERMKTKLGLKTGSELTYRATQWMLQSQ
jgi:DNA-binding NarL/FixJ family response regulator